MVSDALNEYFEENAPTAKKIVERPFSQAVPERLPARPVI